MKPPRVWLAFRGLAWASVCALSITGLTLAQSPRPAADAGSPKAADSDLVTLNAFEVNSATLNGYTATRSLSGSRTAEDIKNLPFAIDVTPLEMWNDFAISPMSGSETLSTTPGMSPLENFAAYAIRGINSSYGLLSDGFFRFGRVDPINTERLEVIKGPAANIYGYTLPGGIVNAIPKVPKSRPAYDVSVASGTLGYYRADANATGPLVTDKLFYRVGLAQSHDEGAQAFRSNKMDAIGAQLLWKINNDSSFRVDSEYTNERRSGRDGVLEAVTEGHAANGTPTTIKDFGPSWYFPNFNRRLNSEPWGYSIFRARELDGTYVNKLNDTFTLRLAGNWRRMDLFTLRGRGNWDPVANRIWSQQPDKGREFHHGHQWNGDLLSQFDTLQVHHRVLLALDYSRAVDEVGPTWRLDPLKYTLANGYPNTQRIKETSAINQDISIPPLSDFTMKFRDQIPANIVTGTLVSDQMKFFQGKVLLTLGGRYDSIRQIIDNLVTSSGVPLHQETRLSKATIQSGVNFVLPYNSVLYGSYSTSFLPQTVLADNGSAFPPIEGKGYDYGIKTSLLRDDQLFATLGYFDLSQTNILSTQTINGVTVNLLTGKVASHGIELSLGGRVWKALTIKLGIGDTHASVARNVTNPTLIGLPPRGIAQWNVGGVLKYDFIQGSLRGFSVGTNVTYVSNYRYSDSSNAALNHVFLPAWIRYDLMASYAWNSSAQHRYRHTVGVVLKNAFNRDYMYGTDPTRGIPRQWVFRYAIDYK